MAQPPKHPQTDCDRSHAATPPDMLINRQALGRIAKLGDLYDATTDNFCKISVFRKQLPPDSPAIFTTDNPDSKIRYINVSSMKDKFRELKIMGELQLSVLAGMCKLEGSAEYLKQRMDGFGTVTSTQLFHVKTVTERLEVLHDQVKNNISEDAIRHLRATHVVIEIQWGANCVIRAMNQRQVNQRRRRTGGGFGTAMSNVPILGRLFLSRIRDIDVEETETSVEISGDVLPNKLPTSLVGAQAMMVNTTELIKNCNSGKGRPLTYVMIPISKLDHLVSATPLQDIRTFIPVDDATIKRIVRKFDEMTELRQEVRDRIGIGREDETRYDDYEARAKSELSRLLMRVRSGITAVGCLDEFHDNYFKSYHLELLNLRHAPWARHQPIPRRHLICL